MLTLVPLLGLPPASGISAVLDLLPKTLTLPSSDSGMEAAHFLGLLLHSGSLLGLITPRSAWTVSMERFHQR